MCHLSRISPEVVEVSCDKTLPSQAFACHRAAFHSGHDSFRPQRVRGGGACSSFTPQKEKQTEEDEEANNIEGPSQQTQAKTRISSLQKNL